MRRRFLVEQFENGVAFLRGDDARHLGRVLRAEPGQLYELSDGKEVWLAQSERIERDSVEFRLIELVPAPPASTFLTLLLAIVKFDRFEWALEKATELGADEIVPLASDRSDKGLILAAAKRAARWRKILHESAQQARRVQVPHLREAATTHKALTACETDARIMLSERAEAKPLRDLLEPIATMVSGDRPATITLAIGPEGGWTDREFSSALKTRFDEATLGANILRTETAVCAALAGIQYAFASRADQSSDHG
jgi:16S rRNA (uracil1498-N3)-methyltransferase